MRSKTSKAYFLGINYRKGMGTELALLVLLVVFGCSTILVTSAITESRDILKAEDEFIYRLTLDEVGEDALTLTSMEFKAKHPDYDATLSDYNGQTTVIIKDKTGESVLEVVTEYGLVKKWDYK